MTKRALLLVDIQNDYFPGGLWPVDDIEAAGAKASVLLEQARKTGDMVVHIRHEVPSNSAPFFQPDTRGAQIHAMVAPKEGEAVILKHRPNSFLQTGLYGVLQDRGIRQVTIIGAMSQMCIDATARAAADHGFQVNVVHDACAAKEVVFGGQKVRAPQVHAAIMGALSGTYATVIDCDAYLAAG